VLIRILNDEVDEYEGRIRGKVGRAGEVGGLIANKKSEILKPFQSA
jgi:hypothetical protein